MQHFGVQKLLHHSGDPACFHQVLHMMVSGRGQMAEVGGPLTDLINHMKVERDICLMCNRQQMKRRVCRAAKRHIRCQSILKRFFCYDIPRAEILSQELHDLHPGRLCQTDALRVDSGDGAVSREAEAQCLCQAVHGIGCKHT